MKDLMRCMPAFDSRGHADVNATADGCVLTRDRTFFDYRERGKRERHLRVQQRVQA
jgi:hypothetical protein